nr:MAG: major capsid protein [Microviridae sp.]WNN13314.1 MAG: major capsid protein [Microvirus sp.]
MNRFVSQHRFAEIPKAEIPRSVFDRSFTTKTAFNSGYLIPVFFDEVLPGDTFDVNASFFTRLATPVVPFMDNLWLDSFFFFVPYRLVWDHWTNMHGERKNPQDSVDYICPTVTAPDGGFGFGSIYDYLGIPPDKKLTVNALPLRACNLIYNEWFRDENLQNSLTVNTGDENDSPSLYNLFRRGKRHDYFTSCLPWPQKGDSVEVSLGGSAPVSLSLTDTPDPTGKICFVSPHPSSSWPDTGFSSFLSLSAEGPFKLGGYGFSSEAGDAGTKAPWTKSVTNSNAVNDAQYSSGLGVYGAAGWNIDTLRAVADLSHASPITINSLRYAFQLQKLLERDARGGTRYTELLQSHFGVTNPDLRLQRPEYLGGSSTRITINPVQQTSSTNDTTPQGNLAAYGVGSDVFHGFNRSFTEYGCIIGFVSVRADLTYQQGLNRAWFRKSRFDFYYPVFSHLGEQTVLNKEIYAQGVDAKDGAGNVIDDQVFGYQERYAEYRYKPSMITGIMRSTAPQSLDVWHLSQKFESLPKLNAEFIQDQPPVNRVVAVQNEPQFIFDAYFKMKCARPMPVYSVPSLVDHF